MNNKPLIISASRATDIPAFFAKKLIHDFEKGFTEKTNPFNRKKYTIPLVDTRFIVFWSKNPKPLFSKLQYFDNRNINYYFQFTLNDYPEFELNLPPLQNRIDTFISLSEKIGRNKILWRFDPIILSPGIPSDEILRRIYHIGEKIHNHTTKLIFSFIDLKYQKTKISLKKHGYELTAIEQKQQKFIAKELKKLADNWKIELKSCASSVDFSGIGIEPNKCIDDELICQLSENDRILQNYLGCVKNISGKYQGLNAKKDKGQRKFCGCINSKDIGEYNTCKHQCLYCYATKH